MQNVNSQQQSSFKTVGDYSESAVEIQSTDSIDGIAYLESAFQQSKDLTNRFTSHLSYRKNSSRDSRESEKLANKLQHLLSILPSAVIILDGRGVVVQCNTAATTILGGPLLNQKWLSVVQRCFKPQNDDGHEVSLTNGKKVKVETRALDYEPGQLILLTDLTETRHLQRQLSQNERLTYLGRMMASLAHQIRTPLSAAMLHAANLQNEGLSQGQVIKFSHRLQQRLQLVERQVNDMLMFVRHGKSSHQSFEWLEVVEQVEQLSQASIGYREILFNSQHPHQSIFLCGSCDDLVGAIQNICDNAIAALAEVEHASISFSSILSNGKLIVSIQDNGCGIHPKNIESIFEPFYTSKDRGTGLGLAIVKKVIESHHGKIRVESEPNIGSKFIITLPLTKSFEQIIEEQSINSSNAEVCDE